MIRTLPRHTRTRYARELLTARRIARRASDRANDAATWALLAYVAVVFAVCAAFAVGRKADTIERQVLTVAQLLQRQTEVILARLPGPEPAPKVDLPTAIAEGA